MGDEHKINVETDALILVDVQRDFCPGGALPVNRGNEAVPVLNEWLKIRKFLKIAPRDWHPPSHCSFKRNGGQRPDHCVQDTPGAQFHPDLHAQLIDVIVSKGTDPKKEAYSGFDAPELLIVLRTHDILRLWIGGLAVGHCLKATAMDARRYGFDVFVIEDAVRGLEVRPGDQERARRKMEEAGVVFVRTQEVVKARSAAGLSVNPQGDPEQ